MTISVCLTPIGKQYLAAVHWTIWYLLRAVRCNVRNPAFSARAAHCWKWEWCTPSCYPLFSSHWKRMFLLIRLHYHICVLLQSRNYWSKWQSKLESTRPADITTCCHNISKNQEPTGCDMGGTAHLPAALGPGCTSLQLGGLQLSSVLITSWTPLTDPCWGQRQQPNFPSASFTNVLPLCAAQGCYMEARWLALSSGFLQVPTANPQWGGEGKKTL